MQFRKVCNSYISYGNTYKYLVLLCTYRHIESVYIYRSTPVQTDSTFHETNTRGLSRVSRFNTSRTVTLDGELDKDSYPKEPVSCPIACTNIVKLNIKVLSLILRQCHFSRQSCKHRRVRGRVITKTHAVGFPIMK